MQDTTSPWNNTGRRRRQTQFHAKRDAVFAAAAALFRDQGYEGTSLVDLADRLQITKPTIYYYAKNKEDLLMRIVQGAQETIIAHIEEAAGRDAPAYDRLWEILVGYAEIMSTDEGACTFRTPWRRIAEPEVLAEMDRRVAKSTRLFLKVLEEGRRDGSLIFQDAEIVRRTTFGALTFASMFPVRDGRSLRRTAELQVELLMNGLRGDAEPAKVPRASVKDPAVAKEPAAKTSKGAKGGTPAPRAKTAAAAKGAAGAPAQARPAKEALSKAAPRPRKSRGKPE